MESAADNMAKKEVGFGLVDYIVFSSMLAMSSAIGVYFAWKDRKNMTNKGFLMGDRKLGVIPVSMSLLASFQSAVTALGHPAQMYLHGTQFSVMVFGAIASVTIAVTLFLPVFFRLHLMSVNEYLQRRFNSVVIRLAASATFIVSTMLYLGVVLYGPSVALSSATKFPVWSSILLIGLICTFYTAIGGMKAVVWTDVIQMTIMIAGLLAVVVKGSLLVGGIGRVWEIAEEGGRISFFDMSADLYSTNTFWNVVFGMGIIWTSVFGTSQTQVQRYCSMSSLRKARTALLLNIPGMVISLSLGCLSGIVIYANYYKCDPLKTGQVERSDQLAPYFVMDHLNSIPGLPGLFVACVFSGSLSTLSSGFNSLAAVLWDDFVKRMYQLKEAQAAIFSRCAAATFGLLTIGVAFLAGRLESVLKAAIALHGALSGPILGIFLLGVLVPCCNSTGALSGLVIADILCMWITVGALVYPPKSTPLPTSIEGCTLNDTLTSMVTNYTSTLAPPPQVVSAIESPNCLLKFYHISPLLVPVFGVLITVGVGIVVSLLTHGNPDEEIEPDLVSPLVFKCCPNFFSRAVRRKTNVAIVDGNDKSDSHHHQNGSKLNGGSWLPISNEDSLSLPNSPVKTEPHNIKSSTFL